jgi:Mn2+/Fe2+ NRAMP family transporter
LCNDRAVLGPWRNPTWLNVLATLIVATLVLLSLILMATTVFPRINVTHFALIGAGVFAAALLAFGAWALYTNAGSGEVTVIEDGPTVPKSQWTMPQLTFLEPAVWSTGRKAAMLGLRAYLVVSVVLLVVKAVQLGGG